MLAVTTRNRLRSRRFCLPVLWSRRLVARQLQGTPGLLRYASAVAAPCEFLTLTVWEDKAAMRAFMQSGAHERVMWRFSRWTASFWGMRWEPSPDEWGAWAGLTLGAATAPVRSLSPLVAAGLLPAQPPRAGRLGPRRETRAIEPRGADLFAVTARLEGASAATAMRTARRVLRAEAWSQPDLVRWAVGLDWPPQALVVSLWRDMPEARIRALALLGERLGASWAMRWQPGDYEIGHWDGLRLRREQPRRTAADR